MFKNTVGKFVTKLYRVQSIAMEPSVNITVRFPLGKVKFLICSSGRSGTEAKSCVEFRISTSKDFGGKWGTDIDLNRNEVT